MQKNTQAGFSLVELMVVVAIIGILATVAIPKVNKFIAKARQSEAQVNLASIYTFNKNFFIEFQGYTSAFGAMGYSPEGNLRYNTGWSTGAAVPTNFTTLKGSGVVLGNSNTLTQCPSTGTACRTLNGSDNKPPPTIGNSLIAADFSTFTAGATATLVGTSVDTWSINQDKNLKNDTDGTL